MPIAEIVFSIPLDKHFDYLIPQAMAGRVRPGHRVLAPLGGRRQDVGVVLRVRNDDTSDVPLEKLKPITSKLDPEPALTSEDLSLAAWMAGRTFCSMGEAVFGVLPVGRMRPPQRASSPRIVRESPAPYGAPRPAALTDDQSAAMAALAPAVDAGGFQPFLLHGVNASGKTEIYLHLIERVLAAGKTAILLVPEIGLTPQTEAHVAARFGDGVAVWHSALSAGERWRIWESTRAGRVRVVLGPRSALFLPLRDLGLIALDEEHDASYKSDSTPHFHARDAALEKARLHRCPVILGSATPSMESLLAAREGRLRSLRMTGRVGNRPFPTVRIVDMRKEPGFYLSTLLVDSLKACLEKKEQSLLLLNRRGFATHVLCKSCGWEARCPHCQINLVHHRVAAKKDDRPTGEFNFAAADPAPAAGDCLRCHTCDHRRPFSGRCDTCNGDVVALKGRGTQRLEGDLKLLYPSARLLRWDRDTTQNKAGHARAFQAVRSNDVDIVLGTRMIAQGLDFPRVTLGAVLDADRILRFPDFRGGERAFQLLSQLAGRVGRGDTPGEVLIQTRHPEHYAVKASETFDYDAFAESELAFRREMDYPPYVRMASILLRSKKADVVQKTAEDMTDALEAAAPPDVRVLGPAPAFHHHKEGFEQWQLIVKAPEGRLESVIPFVKRYDLPAGVTMTLDADPEDLA